MILLKNYRNLKASSILESVIAITIISICSLVAFLIYINVIKHTKSIALYNAEQELKSLILETELNKNFEDELFIYSDFKIDKELERNSNELSVIINWKIITINHVKTSKTIFLNNEH